MTRRRAQRGMTLLEVMVSLAILGMVSLLIYGAFDSMTRGRKSETARVDRARQGRESMLRMARELTSAFLSAHIPYIPAMRTRQTAFIGQHSGRFDRVDFVSFAHRRTERDAKESDQAEVGYFVVRDPERSDKMDLVRREQTPIDLEPKRGGVVNVIAEDVEDFSLKYLDATTGSWVDGWDTTQVSGQPNRLPLEVRIALTLRGINGGPPQKYTTKVVLPIQQPLVFGIVQ